MVTDDHAPANSSPTNRRLGWGAWLAIAGLVMYSIGLVVTALAFDAMTVDQPGQWIPIYVGLAAIGFLAVGLALRSRIAFAIALGAGIFQVVTTLLRYLEGSVVNVPIFELMSLVPGLMVVGGLAASWRGYWQRVR